MHFEYKTFKGFLHLVFVCLGMFFPPNEMFKYLKTFELYGFHRKQKENSNKMLG